MTSPGERIDLEAEYNNRARVPEHPVILETWSRAAAAYRTAVGPRLSTVSYGTSERQRLDLIRPERPADGAAPVMFIHGGYWQALGRDSFSHLARGLNARGITVALAGYDLCPNVTLAAIVGQLQDALGALAAEAGGPVVVTGHSAGGHLAACLLATDWAAFSHGRPRPVTKALAISGLFELDVLVATSVNHKLGLTPEEARHLSPRFWALPTAADGLTFDAWVGAEESAEYLRQSRGIAAAWAAAGMATRYVTIAGANHFTAVAGLEEVNSPLTRRLAELAGGRGGFLQA